jgi:hypothetical protein
MPLVLSRGMVVMASMVVRKYSPAEYCVHAFSGHHYTRLSILDEMQVLLRL